VPVFLLCLFLLQTRFRPEMQEDKYYSRHLAQRYSPETAKSELVEVTESPTEVAEPISQLEINDLLPCFDDII